MDSPYGRRGFKMSRRLPTTIALTLLAALAAAAPAGAAGFAPGQVVVKFEGQRFGRAVALPPRVGVREAASALRRSPRVAYAVPNFIATASATVAPNAAAPVAKQSAKAAVTGLVIPNDPGNITLPRDPPGAWVLKQWNFLPWEGVGTAVLPVSAGGIDAVGAWANLAAIGRPGAKGMTVAVLDTGIAYRAKGSNFRRSPDFVPKQFVDGYDFVDGDRLPLDENGHGTHVAGTIGEKTNNGIGLTGLAYGAGLMPVRVLDQYGRGEADDIAAGIRFAASNGADAINMSFNFGCGKAVPDIDDALRLAYRKGVVTVASVGNLGSETCVSPPATGPHVVGVGGSTEGGCLGGYSLAGEGIDVIAPGGGAPIVGCPSVSGSPIYQVTLKAGSTRRFGIPGNYVGTSMAAAHATAAAAMVIAAGVVNPEKKSRGRVGAVTRRLRATARSLGLPATQQGAGLIDLARATDPEVR
jgi:serine protease